MSKDLVDYVMAAADVFGSLTSHPDVVSRLRADAKPAGGYFCLANQEGRPLLVALLGAPAPAKALKYFELSQEKALRLAKHPEHRLSRSSRNPSEDQWGGAVRGKNLILSFSGLPEQLDEVFSVLVGLDTNELAFADAAVIVTAENWNKYHILVPQIYKVRHPGR